MFKRLKRAMVESFVGAIALGWLLAQGIVYFISAFTSPVQRWILRNEIPGKGIEATLAEYMLRHALSDLVTALFLLLVWYILLRWLYYQPVVKTTPEAIEK